MGWLVPPLSQAFRESAPVLFSEIEPSARVSCPLHIGIPAPGVHVPLRPFWGLPVPRTGGCPKARGNWGSILSPSHVSLHAGPHSCLSSWWESSPARHVWGGSLLKAWACCSQYSVNLHAWHRSPLLLWPRIKFNQEHKRWWLLE